MKSSFLFRVRDNLCKLKNNKFNRPVKISINVLFYGLLDLLFGLRIYEIQVTVTLSRIKKFSYQFEYNSP